MITRSQVFVSFMYHIKNCIGKRLKVAGRFVKISCCMTPGLTELTNENCNGQLQNAPNGHMTQYMPYLPITQGNAKQRKLSHV